MGPRELPRPDRFLTRKLLEWFAAHGRSFPWRSIHDPYHVLCAELMLQRTRASQVVPVFTEFVERFPDPQSFVKAGEEEAVRLFSRLGLNWRAGFFWEFHRTLLNEFEGEVPREHAKLLSLPGVGEYAATAVRVFAFGERDTIVDANVLRIFSRFFGILFPEHLRRNQAFRRWALMFAPEGGTDCRSFNWALIDHGATVCTPQRPKCSVCPLLERCAYGRVHSARDLSLTQLATDTNGTHGKRS